MAACSTNASVLESVGSFADDDGFDGVISSLEKMILEPELIELWDRQGDPQMPCLMEMGHPQC
jgi:hypothetical protein